VSEYFTVIPGKPTWHDSKPVVPESGSAGDSNFRERDWSSSPVADNDNNAWNVNFNNGNVNNNNIDNNNNARCVR